MMTHEIPSRTFSLIVMVQWNSLFILGENTHPMTQFIG